MKHAPKNVSTNVVNWLEIIWLTDLPAEAKLIAAYFRSFMNDKQDVAWPGLKRIARETSMSEPRVKKYRQLLINDGWILVKKGGSGPKDTNRYWANIPPLAGEKLAENLTSKGVQNKGGQIVTPNEIRPLNLSDKGVQIIPPNIQENIQESINCAENKKKKKRKKPNQDRLTEIDRLGIPIQGIADLYNQHLPEYQRCIKVTDARKLNIADRWQEDERHQSLEFWADYFKGSRKIRFEHRTGGNDQGWVADLEFMTREKIFYQNIEILVSQK